MNPNIMTTDTIAAIATAPGKGGIGVIRVSGLLVKKVMQQLIKTKPKPRYAQYCNFYDELDNIIDVGLALYFVAPHSFTGEDVLELHGHGGPVILDLLLKRIISLGVRMAKPGEFSERAFLNNKIDLAQAEAIADLIDASSQQAARAAVNSLQGEFSKYINRFQESLIHLRMFVESSMDFSEEEIDFLKDDSLLKKLQQLIAAVEAVFLQARQGSLLREGLTIVIAGKPNAGKSSLLNCLSGRQSAIVTHVAGTTRDIIKEYVQIDGIPLHVVDTAGLRESDDIVEQEGIRRAEEAIKQADAVLLVVDVQEDRSTDPDLLWPLHSAVVNKSVPIIIIHNKIDLLQQQPVIQKEKSATVIKLSAKHGQGIDLLQQALKELVGASNTIEGKFIARQRHLTALTTALNHLQAAAEQLSKHKAIELLAEELRSAQTALSEITGEFSSDDLLAKIFSEFCIGK